MSRETETEKKIKSITGKIIERQEHWTKLKEYGGSDPNWEDGCNMNLTRNHIISYIREIKEICDEEGLEYPKICETEIPPEVDSRYMARSDEIRQKAKQSLEVYEADGDYKYLLSAAGELDEAQKKQTCIENVLGYVRGLKDFIARDRLVDMRRHEEPERYLDSFRECAAKVRAILKPKPEKEEKILPLGQLSIFDFI